MTIIAYRDDVMAADSQLGGDYTILGSFSKISRSAAGEIVAVCGDCGVIGMFRKWLDSDRAERFDPKIYGGSFGAFVVSQDGQVTCYDEHGCPIRFDADYHADGAGREFALGAMAVGATADDAVRAAIKHSPHCGGPVQVERLR